MLFIQLLPLFSLCHCFANLPNTTDSFVHPITIDGKHFVDSTTHERVLLRGVDYQPGGSAAYSYDRDPLSDAGVCERDIYLMQQLGVNAVRVYSVNPTLNHDDCMTMLAAANIHLLLDVNSPLVGESINRYEPWTTYTSQYLEHVFRVVDQFSRYNNTLAFFIGNEIVNDERSAAVSPPYIRAVTRDVKQYMFYNSPRNIPLGYSAADDLRYRTQLPHYLTCGDRDSAVDFYGVNSYQWCGSQTIKSSGYDKLIEDHAELEFPIIFSEFGCNHVQPRLFQEVEALYSPEMTPYFDGGLVYEFSQELNNYGLVEIESTGDAKMREDFKTLQAQFKKAIQNEEAFKNSTASRPAISTSSSLPTSSSTAESTQKCRYEYSNLRGAGDPLPETFGTEMIHNGVKGIRGAFKASILEKMPVSPYRIYDARGEQIMNPKIKVVNNFNAYASSEPSRRRPRGSLLGDGDISVDKNEKLKTKKSTKNEARTFRKVWGNALKGIIGSIALQV